MHLQQYSKSVYTVFSHRPGSASVSLIWPSVQATWASSRYSFLFSIYHPLPQGVEKMMPQCGLRPERLTGSCLCQSIRYEIVFDKDALWPPPVCSKTSLSSIHVHMKAHRSTKSATCQCTMCRKWTASLLAQFIVVTPEQIVPPLSTFTTYREFSSSPRRHRGFCVNCGSSLIWRSEDKKDTLDLYLGTVDERWLIGDSVAGSEKKTKHGVIVKREGSIGKELCTPSEFQFYYENSIPGVTDLLPGGRKFLTENGAGLVELEN